MDSRVVRVRCFARGQLCGLVRLVVIVFVVVVVAEIADAIAEFIDPLAEGLAEFGQALGPEDDQGDDQYERNL